MKIAIIGCSYSAYSHTNVEKDSWSYQLYERFPQHTYYNYALGGRGIDYAQWCILDAKMNDVDFVFVNRTFYSRVSMLKDTDEPFNEFGFDDTYVNENFILKYIRGNMLWRGTSQPGVGTTRETKPPNNEKPRNFVHNTLDELATSEHRNSWQKHLYNNIEKLYNFKHFRLLEFLRSEPNNVWKMMIEAHGGDDEKIKRSGQNRHEWLWTRGLTLAQNDDHWNREGNKWVLENYILDKETIDILTKG